MLVDPNIVPIDMIKEDNSDIHRGKIGIAKKGSLKVKLNLIETKDALYGSLPGEWDPQVILSQFQFAEDNVRA